MERIQVLRHSPSADVAREMVGREIGGGLGSGYVALKRVMQDGKMRLMSRRCLSSA